MKITMLKAGVVAAVLAMAGGCATTEQLAEVKTIANNAGSAAAAAQSRADAAMAAANSAAEAARAAQSSADAAQSCCNDQKSRLDKLVEDMMKK
jgi:murein lipoprotein